MGDRFRAWAILAFLLAIFAVKGLLLDPPAPHAGEAFDTARAIGRLERILGDQRPHPVDSSANDAVRGRLMAELIALGLKPEVRASEDCSAMPGWRSVSCSLTHNVVAVIGADRPGKALLLNAHYDSTPTGPGAADDGIGVATLLEVAANLQQRPPAEPVIFLFNEGEEFGLNGAAAFAKTDPLAASVGSLINIESRGVSGPAWMFETSEPNGPAIAAFARSSSRPYANSLTADFAKLIPNYTDVVVFKQGHDWRTLSFAIVGNETRYHTPGDRIEWLDRSSVNHMGMQVLAATRALPAGNAAGERVYADIAGRWFVSLPIVLAAVLLGLLIGGAAFVAFRQRALGRPLLACAAAILAGVGVAFVLSFIGGMIRPGDYWRATPIIAYCALYAAVLAAMTAILSWLGRRERRDPLRAACWLLILIVGGILALVVHGAMIFFILAPAIALAGLAIPQARTALLWIAALLQLLMFAELMASIEMLLIDGPLWATAPLAALAALPFLVEIVALPLRRPAVGLAIIGLLLWGTGIVMPRTSVARPGAFTLLYVRDDSDGAAHWAVASKQAPLPARWAEVAKWSAGSLPIDGRRRWIADAPVLDVPHGSVTKVGEASVNGHRLVRLRLDRGGGDAVMIRFDGKAPIIAMGLPGQLAPMPAKGDGPFVLRCSGRSCDGMTVELELANGSPVDATVATTRFALPLEAKPLLDRFPANAHPQYGPNSSVRLAPVTL